MKHIITILFISTLLFSCGPIQRVDTTAVKEEMNNLQIKRLTPAQINAQVEMLGEKITKSLTPALEQILSKSLDKSAICQLANSKLIDSLSKFYAVKIRLLGKADMQNKLLFGKEKEVLDAYIYNIENKLPLGNNIQKISDTLFVYTAPIATNSNICNTCFGNDADKLAVWSIVFSKAAVIRKIDMKKL